jgi:ubiquinone/menaquinone biosynthesis C-methylase UbiE
MDSVRCVTPSRQAQLEYSDSMPLMLDENSRRSKAAKIASVVEHFRGIEDLSGLRVLDIGCSAGIVAAELQSRGAEVIGVDIDRPGLAKASGRFGDGPSFVCADSQRMPFADRSADVLICNHVYEHVVDPVELFAEMRRILRNEGLMYLGLGNRLGVMEPHYRLPFLSYLPRSLAHRYVRATRRADHYHEAFTTWSGLRELCAGLHVWDYTLTVLGSPETFAASDVVPRWLKRVPRRALRLARPLVPTYIWVATLAESQPAGPTLSADPEFVTTPST